MKTHVIALAILLATSCAQEDIKPRNDCWRCTAWMVSQGRNKSGSTGVEISSWEEKQCGYQQGPELDRLMASRRTTVIKGDGSGVVYNYLNCTEQWH